jgi:uncharacterized membrane-anchored protein YitT (DUF2179 family)
LEKTIIVGDFMNLKQEIIESIFTVIASLIMAVGIALFLLPNQLSSGGVSGIATITYYLFNIPMGRVILLINIPLFLVSIFKLGKSFFIKSIIGTVSLSFFVDILDKMEPLSDDRLLASIYGGILVGLGTALLFKANSSTGGTDLITQLIKHYNHNIRTGTTIIIIDIIIVALNIIFFKEIQIGLYSAIAIYLAGKMVDIMFEGIYFTKLLFIVTNKAEEIAKEIGIKIGRGTTGLYGKGMYTKKDKTILMCAANRGDVARVKNVAKKIDPRLFYCYNKC